MLSRLISWSLENRLLVSMSAAIVLAFGAWTATQLPVDVFPDLSAPRVTVVAEAHGMAPEEVEALVTFPIEAAINGATAVRKVRSSTAHGIAVVWIEFEWGTNVFHARQVVTEKLQAVATSLPSDVSPPVLAPMSSIMGEIMMVGLTGTQSPEELRTVADWIVRRRLLALRGVSQVVAMGGEVRQYQVLPDPALMQAVDVSLDDIVDAAADSNANASGGVFMDRGQEYTIRGLGRVETVSDIESTVVAVRGDVPVLLGEVAEVRIGPAPKFGDGSVNARSGVVLTVKKQPGANTLELTELIQRELDDIQRTLPEGMVLHADLFRQSRFIDAAIGNVLAALRDGAVLVVIVLFLFLLDVRATAISVLAIPLSLVIAIFALKALGSSINTMTLGGMAIAIGALVDDAIIVVENSFRRLKENHRRPAGEREAPAVVVRRAAQEILGSIVNATLIIAVVFLPLFFLSGVEGRLLQPLGIAYIVSILASLLVAVTVTPVLCLWLLPSARSVVEEREGALIRWLKARYAPTVVYALRRPRIVVASAVSAVVLAIVATPLLGTSFLPEFNEGALTVSVVTVPGTSLEESNAIGLRVEEIFVAHPAVASVDRRQGRAEMDEHALGVNAGELDVVLQPDIDKPRVLEELRSQLSIFPGTSITIGQPISHRIDHMLSGTRANIAVKVFGPELRELRRIGGQVRDAITGVTGVADLQLEQQIDVPQVRIRADRQAMARHGMTAGKLAETIDVAFNGERVSEVLEEGKSFDLVVRLPESARTGPEAIGNVRVDTPTGARVPLSQLARIGIERGPNAISREGVQRKIVVQANVAGRDLGTTVADIQRRVDERVVLPAGYHVEYGGQFESQESASRTIAVLSLLSVLAIFVLLFREFASARLALLILVNLPLALIGGIVAVAVSGGVVSIASLVGFVTLFGIATRNGVLLVSHYQRLEAEGVPPEEAVIRGSLERLAPIFMTALTAALALVPLALGAGEPGSELQSPLAIVVLGGLLSATALNMVVVPALYRAVAHRGAAGRDAGL